MTTPIGDARVDVVAHVNEDQMADSARKAGRKSGEEAASAFAKKFQVVATKHAIKNGFLSRPNHAAVDGPASALGGRAGRRFGLRFLRSAKDVIGGGAGRLLGGLNLANKGIGKAFGAVGGLGRFTKLILAATVATLALVPAIGNVYNGLLEIGGALVGLPALLVGLGASIGVIKAGMKGLQYAVAPVKAAFHGFERDVSAVFARLRPVFADFAKTQIPLIRKALTRLATPLASLIGQFVSDFGRIGGGAKIAGFLDNFGLAITNLKASAEPILRILLQMITQVGERLPGLAARFSAFMDRLAGRAANVDFGAWFERGVNGIVNLGAAIIKVGIILREFFMAAAGQESRSMQPFQGLREWLDGLLILVRENRGTIRQFFEDLHTVLGAMFEVLVWLAPKLADFARAISWVINLAEAHPDIFKALVITLSLLKAGTVLANSALAILILRLFGIGGAGTAAGVGGAAAATGIGRIGPAATRALGPLGLLIGALGTAYVAMTRFLTDKFDGGFSNLSRQWVPDFLLGDDAQRRKRGDDARPVATGTGQETKDRLSDLAEERGLKSGASKSMVKRNEASAKSYTKLEAARKDALDFKLGTAPGFGDWFDKQAKGVEGAKEAVQAAADATTKALEKQRDAIKAQIEVLEAFRDKMAEFYKSVIDQVRSFVTITALADDPAAATAGGIIKTLQDRVAAIALMTKNLASLQRRGLDRGVLAELALAGPESRGFVSALATATPAQIAALNAAEKQARGLAATLANQAMDRQFGNGAFAKNQAALAEQNRRLANIERLLAAQPALLSKALKSAEKSGTLVSGGRVVA